MEKTYKLLDKNGQADLLLARSLCLTEDEKLELYGMRGHKDFARAIENSVRISTMTWAGFYDESLVALFGFLLMDTDSDNNKIRTLRPWALCSEESYKHPKAFISTSKTFIKRFEDFKLPMENFVGTHNHRSIKWLTRAGFSVDKNTTYTNKKNDVKFYKFTRRL